MSEFAKYLTESSKEYDYRIKVAGDLDKDFGSKLETCLQKYEVAKLSAGKTTPIVEMPLDFPNLKNEKVTIFDVTTHYPASVMELRELVADYMRCSPNFVVVRKPNEPTEEYQEEAKVKAKSEYKTRLLDLEYQDAPKVKGEDFHSTKANMSLLKELLKDKKDGETTHRHEYAAKPEKHDVQEKEDKPTPSPLTKTTNPKPKR
tara:strand:+ start:481 stop:1089 length:609 start_codon:yes stop_codon:yes gene_type:complete